jgi:hypothetical protein
VLLFSAGRHENNRGAFMKIRSRAVALGAALLALSAAACTPSSEPRAALAVESKTTSGRDENSAWSITRLGDTWTVSLRVEEPAPLRASPPVLAVNGEPIGAARELGDRRTLTVVTNEPVPEDGVVSLWQPSAADTRAGRGFAPSATPAPVPVTKRDPGTSGKFGVNVREYDLGDEAVTLPGLNGHQAELRGRVYSPQGKKGPLPMVLFLHGRHQPCFGPFPDDFENPWPCAPGNSPVPSYRGYDAPARALASNGYIVVSISANAINALDFEALDGGALARAELVLAHLDRWRTWANSGGGPFGTAFVGRVDLRNVGLMGHSRGGEGVVRAALLNAAQGNRFGIRALVALAPTDFARPTIPGIATNVILPYCDGDVLDLQGQHYYDDTRYATKDKTLRSSVLVMGANHNFFNTEWTPGSVAPSFDDWFGEPADTCGTATPERLTPPEQVAVGRTYIAGWFRTVLGRTTAFLPLYDGSGTRAPSAGVAEVHTVAQSPSTARRDLARFDRAEPAVHVSGDASARLCEGAPAGFAGPPEPAVGYCADIFDYQSPHWTIAPLAFGAPIPRVTELTWTSTGGALRVDLPQEKRNFKPYSALSVRLAPDPDSSGPVDFTVRLTDSSGKTADVVVSAVSDALDPLPGLFDPLPKTYLRTLRIPLKTIGGINLYKVRRIEFLTNRVAQGSVLLSDLALSRPGIGASGRIDLPRLSVGDVTIDEGDTGTQTMRFKVNLSRTTASTVRVHVDAATGFLATNGVHPLSRTFVVTPGRRSFTVPVVVDNDLVAAPDRVFPVVLSVPTNAVLDRSIATGTVRDDEPLPTVSLGPASGVEGSGEVLLPLTLSAPTADGVFVDVELSSGTATLGSDYPDEFGFGFVDALATTGNVFVTVTDDDLVEPDETFTARVVSVFGAVLAGPDTVTGTIVDDD